MAWKQILEAGNTVSDEFPTATPFMVRVEGEGALSALLRLQSKRIIENSVDEDTDADWDVGQILPSGTMIPCYGCPSTIYRITSNVNTIELFYVDVLTSQTDRRWS